MRSKPFGRGAVFPTIFAFAGMVFLAGCGAAPPDGPITEVIDSAGVRIVLNPAEDFLLDWRFEPTLVLGGAEDGPEAFYQVGFGSIGTDQDGNLYVLDRGQHHILVFDGDGQHLRTMGRQGGGPGELQWPSTLIVWPDGSSAVSDIGKRGLIRFDPNGEPSGEQLLEGWNGGRVAPLAETFVVEVQERDGEALYGRLVALNGEAREIVSDERPPMRPVDFGCVRMSGMPRVFAPSLVWGAGPDVLAVARSAEYAVDLYDADRRLVSVRRALEPRRVTHALAIEEIGDEFRVLFGGGGVCNVSADRVVEERGYADVMPAVGQVAFAPDGSLWVQRREVRGAERAIDIFGRQGEYVGTLPPGTPFPVAFMPDGRVIAVERDEFDVPRIIVHQIVGQADVAG
jgi:hypothetical protein